MQEDLAKLRVLQETVVWEGHLLTAPAATQYLIAKHKYFKTKLLNILIGKRFHRNAFCYT